MPEPLDYLTEFRQLLDELGLEAVVIGAVAAGRYRLVPRTTTDLDFLARRLDGLAAKAASLGFEVSSMAEPGEEPYLVFIRGHGRQVDVLRAETEYQREALDRGVDGWLTVEDVIVHKLIAWRPRDRDDITQILASGHDLDAAYILRWATEWDVTDRWVIATGRADS